MLVLGESQKEALRRDAAARFESDMVAHCFRVFPERCEPRGEARVREVVRDGIARAVAQGFCARRGACVYLTLIFYLGAGFAEDPAFSSWVVEALAARSHLDERIAARVLSSSALDFLARAEGVANEHLLRALSRVRGASLESLFPDERLDIAPYIVERLRWIHPARCSAIGGEALSRLVERAAARAARYAYSTAAEVGVYAGLAFFLGAIFDEDPMFPWAGEILARAPEEAPPANAARLLAAAQRYLDTGAV